MSEMFIKARHQADTIANDMINQYGGRLVRKVVLKTRYELPHNRSSIVFQYLISEHGFSDKHKFLLIPEKVVVNNGAN